MPNKKTSPSCACGRRYPAERWAQLSLLIRLSAAEVATLLSPWPAHLHVEVRECSGCGRELSRLTDLSAPGAAA